MKHLLLFWEHVTHSPMSAQEKISSVLRDAGLKATQARIALLDLLMKEEGPFTLEELHRRARGQKCDLVTVYRSLAAFEEASIVRRCDFGDGTVRYEFQGEEHHHHIICRKCRKVEHLDLCLVENIEKKLEKQGYTKISHSLEFFGICRACQN